MKEIRCDKVRHSHLSMVFAHHPDGPRLYTGSIRCIYEHTKNEPTHHGFVVNYKGGRKISDPSGHHVILLGKNNSIGKYVQLLQLEYVSEDRQAYRKFYDKKSKFCLFLHCKGETHLIHRWRRLPKKYLTHLGEADEALDSKEQ